MLNDEQHKLRKLHDENYSRAGAEKDEVDVYEAFQGFSVSLNQKREPKPD
jgi:hypothetical protein